MKTYVIDIDGTICTNTFGDYEKAIPFHERIAYINYLYEEGNIIKFFTARGSGTGINWKEKTSKQLDNWNVKFHELILGKPEGDIFIDDKAFNSEAWNWEYKSHDLNQRKLNSLKEIDNALILQLETIKQILTKEEFKESLFNIAEDIKKSFANGGKVIFAGNGGSFSDSQHLAAEFISRFTTDRIPLPSLALATNSSNLTAIGNDYGFENIFSRELKAIGGKNDILIAITTSGNSQNIIKLIDQAEELSINYYILTGKSGGDLFKQNKRCLKVPSESTAIVQQIHITIGHLLVGLVEKEFLKKV